MRNAKTLMVAMAMAAACMPCGGAGEVNTAPGAPDVPVPVPNRGRTRGGLASGQVANRKNKAKGRRGRR
jgi:hypothetical protein